MSETRTIVDRDGREHRFPPPLERAHRVVEGRVVTRSLEAHVVDHCNLRCAECCSLSPLLPPRFESPEALARDLARAAAVLAPAVFKLVGGEPLLHPELLELVHVARRSGIAPRVSLTTNGLLLHRMPDALWQQLDGLTISRYPRPRIPAARVAEIEAKGARFGVRINWKQQDAFVQMSRPHGPADPAETAAVYGRCWLRERCHLLRDGHFHTCTRPVHLATLHHADPRPDGLALEGCTPEGVLAYLRRETPLAACAHCAGGDAPMVPHRLLSPQDLRRDRRPRAPGGGAGSPREPA
ncbi:MAG: radical SAM protein [Myxococcales bacterium]|nr:radical SAM protein [Myxococcales bacterium]